MPTEFYEDEEQIIEAYYTGKLADSYPMLARAIETIADIRLNTFIQMSAANDTVREEVERQTMKLLYNGDFPRQISLLEDLTEWAKIWFDRRHINPSLYDFCFKRFLAYKKLYKEERQKQGLTVACVDS